MQREASESDSLRVELSVIDRQLTEAIEALAWHKAALRSADSYGESTYDKLSEARMPLDLPNPDLIGTIAF